MNILFLNQNFQPEPMFKGLPLVDAFRKRGHQVEVLTTFPNYPGGKIYPGYRQRLWQHEWLNETKINRVPLVPNHSRSGVRRILSYASFGMSAFLGSPFLVKKPDLIYIYNLITLVPAARLLRLLYGSRIVLDIQDLWPESVASSGMMQSALSLKLLKYFCRNQYMRADRLVVLSPGFKRNLVDRGIPESKVDVVYNWCDESSITVPMPDAEMSERFGLAGRFNIVFAGTMGVVQALDCVIEAARKLQHSDPKILFTFIGGGIEIDRLKALSADLPNVQFLPSLPQNEIGNVYSNSDVLLVHLKDDPIFRITVPSKIQAYLYAGKPILCGVRGDASDLIVESKSGLIFNPEDSESLVSAVKSLYYMPAQDRLRMGESGRRFYHDTLSMSHGIAQLESVFNSAYASGRNK